MTTDAKRVRILRATGEDSFPAIEVAAAAPCVPTDDGQVLVPARVDAAGAGRWAELLTAELDVRAWSLQAIADCAEWTHYLRLQTEDGVRDFVVRACGLPADGFEALAGGLEEVELEVAVGPPPGDDRLN